MNIMSGKQFNEESGSNTVKESSFVVVSEDLDNPYALEIEENGNVNIFGCRSDYEIENATAENVFYLLETYFN